MIWQIINKLSFMIIEQRGARLCIQKTHYNRHNNTFDEGSFIMATRRFRVSRGEEEEGEKEEEERKSQSGFLGEDALRSGSSADQ